jgi:hypothetical protein
VDLNTNTTDSWYYRLYQVVSTLVTQLVLIECGYRGSQPLEEPSVVANILMHVPTPPRSSDNAYPPFPCMSDNLPDWAKFLCDEPDSSGDEESEQDDGDAIIPEAPKYTAQTKIVEEQRAEYTNLDSSTHGLTGPKLQRVVHQSNIETASDTKPIRDALTTADLTPVPPPKQLKIGDIPPAPFYALELSATDFALIAGNNVTKVSIAMELARQEKDAWTDMRNSCDRQVGVWDMKIMSLAEQQQAIRDLKGEVSNKMASLEQQATTIDGQEAEIESYVEIHPSRKSLLDKEVARNRERQREKILDGQHSSSSPFAIYAPTPHGSPAIPTLQGYFLL